MKKNKSLNFYSLLCYLYRYISNLNWKDYENKADLYAGTVMVGSDSGGAGSDVRQIMETSGAGGKEESASDSDKADRRDLSERRGGKELPANAESVYVANEVSGYADSWQPLYKRKRVGTMGKAGR